MSTTNNQFIMLNQTENTTTFDDKFVVMDTTTFKPDPTFYYFDFKEWAGHVNTYSIPIIVIGGTIGNILSVMVFLRTKLKKLSSSYYLAFLAIFDTGFLWCTFIEWLNVFNIDLYKKNGLCKLFHFTSGVCSNLSVWLVVAFTIERFVAVMYPLKRQSFYTVRKARCIVCVLIAFFVMFSAPVLIYTTTETQDVGIICVIGSNYNKFVIYYNLVDAVLNFVIPLGLIVTLNTITAFAVWKPSNAGRNVNTYNRFPRERSVSFRGSNARERSSSERVMSDPSTRITMCRLLNGHQSIRQSCPEMHRHRITISNATQMKVTKMLLLISTVYVILNLPSYMLRAFTFLFNAEENKTYWLITYQYFAQILYILNFGINFVLYCFSGQNFRKELMSLFKRNVPQRIDVGTHVTSIAF